LARKARLAPPFAQLGVITDMRNNLVHWQVRKGAHRTETVYISNGHVWPPDERLTHMRLTIANLHEMREDLWQVTLCFINEFNLLGADGGFEEYMRGPWRYKPPPLGPRRKSNPEIAQVRRRPPSAWRSKPPES
jgi:hypothetical protein